MSLGFIRDLTPVQPEIVFEIFGFRVANSTLMLLLMTLLFAILGAFVVNKFKRKPGKAQSFIEMTYEGILSLIQQITGSAKSAKAILPIIGTILVYFVISNIITIIPGLTSINVNGVAMFRGPTTDINTIIGVSIATIIALNAVSFKQYGFLGYLGIYFPLKNIARGFKKGILDGFIALIELFVGALGIVGELAKATSLTFRLFGNMFAGAALSTIILGAVGFVLPVAWTLMNGFTSILQGIVYAILVTVYYTLSLKNDESTSS